MLECAKTVRSYLSTAVQCTGTVLYYTHVLQVTSLLGPPQFCYGTSLVSVCKIALYDNYGVHRRHLHRVRILHVLFTGQILHKQLLNLLKSTVYTITTVARCSARQLRAPPQRSPYAPAVPTRLAGQGRTHRHHLPLPPYSLSESLAAKAQPQ
jgi:hypothetical protein